MTNTKTKGATAPKQIDTATLDRVVGASTSAAKPPRLTVENQVKSEIR
jgi:hypothetical protein